MIIDLSLTGGGVCEVMIVRVASAPNAPVNASLSTGGTLNRPARCTNARMRRRDLVSLSPGSRSSTPERARRPGSTLRQRVQRQRQHEAHTNPSGADGARAPESDSLRELLLTVRWAQGQEPLDAVALQYDFDGRFVQLVDARRSPLEWRDTAASQQYERPWDQDGGGARSEWRLTASHSGELVDDARREARHEIAVHLEDVCPSVQSLFFVVCARGGSIGRALSRQQVELRTLERGGGSLELPLLLPLGPAAASAGSAVLCRVWRRSVADGWAAEKVGLPAAAVGGDQYVGLIDAVAAWLSVQMSARGALSDDNGLPPPAAAFSSPARGGSPRRVAPEPRLPARSAAAVSQFNLESQLTKSRAEHLSAMQDLRRQNLDLQADLESVVEEGVGAREQLEEEVRLLMEQLTQSKQREHASVQKAERLAAANKELIGRVRAKQAEVEEAMRKAAESHEARVLLLNRRRRAGTSATSGSGSGSGSSRRRSVSASVHGGSDDGLGDEENEVEQSSAALLEKLRALQRSFDAKCDELAVSQDERQASADRLEQAERELAALRREGDEDAMDRIM